MYLESTSTQLEHEIWLIDSGASFHRKPHREWFYEYERYDGGYVLLGDNLKMKIVGRGRVQLLL
jgi:hypothetical protein